MARWLQKYYEEQVEKARSKIFNMGTPTVSKNNLSENPNTIDTNKSIDKDISSFDSKKIDENKAESLVDSDLDIFNAIKNLDIELVKELIANGADINQKDKNGDTSLNIAITRYLYNNKFLDIIKILLENKANPYIENNKNLNTMDIITSHGYSYKEVRELFKQFDYYKNIENPNDFKDGVTLLYYAVAEENIQEVKTLLENGADINKKNKDKIPYEHPFLVWYDDERKTPIEKAVMIGNIEILELLINQDSNINISKVLHFAVVYEQIEMIEKLLIERNTNPNNITRSDGYKSLPLKLACEKQNFKIVKLLVENGADVNLTGYEGRTALFDAIEATKANKEIIRYLIQNGADIYQENDKGITPLSFAESNKKSLVKTLTESIPLKLDENIGDEKNISFKELNDQVANQTKLIKKLQDEIKLIKTIRSDDSNKELKNLVQKLESDIIFKSNKIQELQNKLIEKEDETKKIIEEFSSKFEKLEKSLSMKQKTTKKPFNPDIQVKNKSVNQNNGVIVKRESFDDF